MKIRFNPVLYIFVFYSCLSAYLIFSYFSLQQYLSDIEVINLSPVAYGLLIVSSIVLALSLLSLFRIPIFHYLFKMVHLWMVILSGCILYLYFKYGHILSGVINAETPQKIADIFPGTQPDVFSPTIGLVRTGVKNFNNHVANIYLAITIVLAIIQLILYLPSSLRYVYYTHVSPIKYTLKHILVSLLLLVPIVFSANYLFRLDTSVNPKLEKLLTLKQQNINDRDNAFYSILTLWIPNVPDRISYGKNWLAGLQKMRSYFRQRKTPVNPAEYPDYQELALGGMSTADQAAINQLYIRRLQKDDGQLNKQIANYINKFQTPLQTARTFYINKTYQNPINYTDLSYTDLYSNYAGSFLSLLRLNLLADLINHDTDIALMVKNIRNNYYFNLKVIRHSSDPNIKLLYINKQAVIVQFLYSLLHNPKFQNNDIYNLINHLPVLHKAVMDQMLIAKDNLQFLNGELVQANRRLSSMKSPIANFIAYTYKYNKTLNCIYRRAIKKYNLDNQTIVTHINGKNSNSEKSSPDNLIGNAICRTSMADSKDDIYIKAVETNGRILILKARSKIYEDKINIFNVATYLNNHSANYYNPFSGGALKWDRDADQIYFEYNNGSNKVKISY